LSHHFVLSDYENVQFTDAGGFKPGDCRIRVFIGQNQANVPVDLVKALLPFGSDADLLRISGTGPNALDFHIAFYIGRWATEFPGSTFTIISKDTGFDPLIRHLATQDIVCRRVQKLPVAANPSAAAATTPSVAVVKKTTPVKKAVGKNVVVTIMPASHAKPAATAAEANTKSRVTEALKRLKGMNSSKPTRMATLQSTIKSFFKPALNDKQLASVIQSLADSKKIVISNTKVTYSL
jgi:hypothetical protein